MSNQTEAPPGAIIHEPEIIPGEKQCQNCTHYRSQHLEGHHCKQLMYELPLDQDQQAYENAGHFVPKTRQLCSCKEFVE